MHHLLLVGFHGDMFAFLLMNPISYAKKYLVLKVAM